MATTNIQVDVSKLEADQLLKDAIKSLEKKVKGLETRIKTRDRKIAELQSGMDLTKEKRAEIRDLANDLVETLDEAGWVDIDRNW